MVEKRATRKGGEKGERALRFSGTSTFSIPPPERSLKSIWFKYIQFGGQVKRGKGRGKKKVGEKGKGKGRKVAVSSKLFVNLIDRNGGREKKGRKRRRRRRAIAHHRPQQLLPEKAKEEKGRNRTMLPFFIHIFIVPRCQVDSNRERKKKKEKE